METDLIAPPVPAESLAPRPGLYYVSESGEPVELLNFPLITDSNLLLTDHNEDDIDEVWWTEGGTLYRKDLNTVEIDDAINRQVITIEMAEFINQIIPGTGPVSLQVGNFQALDFADISTDMHYWEWILSDHYDVLSDITKRPENRSARVWDRYAYIDRDELAETGIKIDYIAGNPEFDSDILVSDTVKVGFSVTLDNDDQVELTLPDGSGVSLLAGETYNLQPILDGQIDTSLDRETLKNGFSVLIGIRDNIRTGLLGPFYSPASLK